MARHGLPEGKDRILDVFVLLSPTIPSLAGAQKINWEKCQRYHPDNKTALGRAQRTPSVAQRMHPGSRCEEQWG